MASNGTVKVKIVGDSVQLEQTFDKVEARGSAMEGIFQGIGQKIGGGLAQLPGMVTGFLSDSIGAASDLGETMSKTSAIFGSDAIPALDAWSDTASTAFGQSKQQALDAAATFGVFGKSAGLAGADLADFSQSNTELASDLASFHNTSPEEAIQAIGAAFRGEAEPMRRYGVLLDDASMRQKALEMGIVSTTKDALTPQQKVLAAQALMMEQTSDAQGDFERTSSGLANMQRTVAARFEDVKIQVGEKLLPVMLQFVGFLLNNVMPAMEGLISWIGRASEFISSHREIMIGLAVAALPLVVAGLIALAAAGWAAVAPILVAAAPFIAIGVILGAVAAAVVYAYNHFDTFKNVVDTMKNVVVAAFNVLKTVIGIAIDIIIGYVNGWITVIRTIWNVADDVIGRVIGLFGGIGGRIGGAMSGLADLIRGPFEAAFNGVAWAWNSTVGSLSFHTPDWIPGIGGKGFDVPDIPTFAQGGFVSGPTLAVVGDNADGSGEHMVGDKKMRQLLREEGAGGISIGTINMGYASPSELVADLDWMMKTRGI